jgi:hypothetical protein
MMKGQTSQEFFLSLTAYLVLFIAAVSVSMFHLSLLTQAKNSLAARDTAQELGTAMDNVYLAGENASYNLSFAKDSNASIELNGRFLYVTIGDSMADFVLLTDMVNTTSINSSDITIKNLNGVVSVEEH